MGTGLIPKTSKQTGNRTVHFFRSMTNSRFDRQAASQGSVYVPRSASNPLFEETSHRAIRAAHRRKWTLVGVILLLVAAGVGLFVQHSVEVKRERALALEYVGIEGEFNAELQRFQTELQAKGDKVTPDFAPNHESSSKRFAEFAKKYPDNALGWQAALRAVSHFVEKKRVDDAITLLEPLTGKTRKNTIFQTRIRRTLAGLYAQKGEHDKALSEIELVEKLPDNPVPAETRLFKAQLLHGAGKKDQAAALLKELAASPAGEADLGGKSVSAEASLWLSYWGLN